MKKPSPQLTPRNNWSHSKVGAGGVARRTSGLRLPKGSFGQGGTGVLGGDGLAHQLADQLAVFEKQLIHQLTHQLTHQLNFGKIDNWPVNCFSKTVNILLTLLKEVETHFEKTVS